MFREFGRASTGLSRRASLSDILKAQIEEHRADVFYNLDATGWDARFYQESSGMRQERHRLACRAASRMYRSRPMISSSAIFRRSLQRSSSRDAGQGISFPPTIRNLSRSRFARIGRSMWCSSGVIRAITGEGRRSLEAVAKLAGEYNVVYHLDRSRLCRLAESPLGQFLPLAKHRRPPAIRAVTRSRNSAGTIMRCCRRPKLC